MHVLYDVRKMYTYAKNVHSWGKFTPERIAYIKMKPKHLCHMAVGRPCVYGFLMVCGWKNGDKYLRLTLDC